MENETQDFTEDEYAKNEPPVLACDLLAEIEPLLKDYFKGEVSFDGKTLTYALMNGQKFKLSAEEVVKIYQ